ncbi:MAG TPA: glycosyltransferase family 39 protein [Candidatus Binataceae bacterium]|nr:glycosyltransferase family 39 protein [Candidatus Binataceae bacterium]
MRAEQSTYNLGAITRTQITLFAFILAGAAAYVLRIGHDPLGASEAYSAWAASKPGIGAILGIPVLYDPGKQILYYILLHYFALPFGYSETALRALSLIFALGDLALVYAVACELFDAETGVAALAIWVFNPLAMIFAYRARGYSMLIFVGLAQMIALWRLRAAPNAARTLLCGVLGAALLFTHMSGLLILGAEGAMLVRDFVRGRRNPQAWIAMGITALLFVPYLPIAMTQSHQLVSGHWLDWIGSPHYALLTRIASGCVAGAVGIFMVFAPPFESRRDEPLRWLAAWSLLPILALLAGSIVMRPMFNPRYVAPSFAVLAILAAGGLACWSIKLRNLTAGGLAVAFLLMTPYDRPGDEPWPQLVQTIAAAHAAAQPIFFESGFIAHGAAGKIANGGFPFGYYSVPFDYYFHGPNPRVTIPGHDPAAGRAQIEAAVRASGGAWLISWKDREVAAELPDAPHFRVTTIAKQPQLAVYRIVPAR